MTKLGGYVVIKLAVIATTCALFAVWATPAHSMDYLHEKKFPNVLCSTPKESQSITSYHALNPNWVGLYFLEHKVIVLRERICYEILYSVDPTWGLFVLGHELGHEFCNCADEDFADRYGVKVVPWLAAYLKVKYNRTTLAEVKRDR